MLTIAVCDDDPAFAYTLTQKLRELCAHYVPDHIDCQILPEFTSANEVLRYLSKYSIDILFLDIVMPQTNGFQLAGVLMERYPNTLILFVSAHDDFVYKSFAFNPFRFLRKEHLAKELPYALQKAVEKCMAENEILSLQTTEGKIVVRIQDILYFLSEKNYYSVHCASGAVYRCRGTISSVEQATQKYDFFRIRPACLINKTHIKHVDDKKGAVHMKDGAVISISRSKISEFINSYAKSTHNAK